MDLSGHAVLVQHAIWLLDAWVFFFFNFDFNFSSLLHWDLSLQGKPITTLASQQKDFPPKDLLKGSSKEARMHPKSLAHHQSPNFQTPLSTPHLLRPTGSQPDDLRKFRVDFPQDGGRSRTQKGRTNNKTAGLKKLFDLSHLSRFTGTSIEPPQPLVGLLIPKMCLLHAGGQGEPISAFFVGVNGRRARPREPWWVS